jgi:PmbA protein
MFDFDDWKSEVLAKIDTGLKEGRNLGIDSLELFISNIHDLRVQMNSGLIEAKQGGIIGVGCRCKVGQKIGFASASGIDASEISFSIKSAFEAAKNSQDDDRWKSFVDDTAIGKEGKLESEVIEFSPEDIVKGTLRIYNEAKSYDNTINSVDIDASLSYGVIGIGNSNGILKASSTTKGQVFTEITAVNNGKTKATYGYVLGRGVPNFEGLGTEVAEKTVKMLKSKPMNYTGQLRVVFDNETAGQLLKSALYNSINGKSVVEGRSAFEDKINGKVGVSFLDIYDDGQIPEDPKTQAIDDEGFPRQRTPIIKKGILKNFIFDNYYSQIYGSKNTGNAKRYFATQIYESIPNIFPNSICLNPGSKDLDTIIAEIDSGIYIIDILMGMHTANTISGDFSIVAPLGYKIENGEITNPIDAVSIAGNLYKSFNQIIAIGDDAKLTDIGKIPTIAFDGFTISG